MALLIDSSVWIAAAHPKNKEYLRLKRLIEKNELIYLTWFIQSEICQGARTEVEFHKLWNGLLGFDFLEVEARHWRLSAWNYFRCRKQGITVSTLDSVIGTLGKEFGVPVWTLDKALLRAKSIIGFEAFA